MTGTMDKNIRIEKLKQIKASEQPIQSNVSLIYRGQDVNFDVYRIPLEYLVYNPYNGRIGTKVKTFEKKNGPIEPENPDHKKIIENYLWESNTTKNKDTIKHLKKYKQRQYGIVSSDGFIIDGNRRASLLNKIYEESKNSTNVNYDFAGYFNAIILDDLGDKKEILKLETTYQMGMDEKLDYNAPEKYLKCKELLDSDFSIKQIAEMMNETEKKIQEYIDIMSLMDEYLEYYDYKEMYSMLERREGQLVDLQNYLKTYKAASRNGRTNWAFEDRDIEDLKLIAFDYIRARYEGKEFREIAKTGRSENSSFFSNKRVWDQFKEDHNEIETVSDNELSTSEYLDKKNFNSGDINKVLDDRDSVWIKQVKNTMKKNMSKSNKKLNNARDAEQPTKLLSDALDSLESINFEDENFHTEECFNLIREIGSKQWDLKKYLEKKVK